MRLILLIIIAIALIVVAVALQYSDSEEISTKRNSDFVPHGTGQVGLSVLPADVEDRLSEQENE